MITVQAVDSSGEDTDHLHSIVIKLGGSGADFSIEGLLESSMARPWKFYDQIWKPSTSTGRIRRPRVPIER